MLLRLIGPCAAYHKRFGTWPTQVRMAPDSGPNLARELNPIESLCGRVEVRTSDLVHSGNYTVSGVGVINYDGYEVRGLGAS